MKGSGNGWCTTNGEDSIVITSGNAGGQAVYRCVVRTASDRVSNIGDGRIFADSLHIIARVQCKSTVGTGTTGIGIGKCINF